MTHNATVTDAGPEDKSPGLTFLRWLYGDDAPGWLTIFTLPGEHTEWFRTSQQPQAAAYALTQAYSHDVYVGVCLRKDRLAHGRGTAGDVQAVPGLYLDIDLKDDHAHKKTNLPETVTQVYDLLQHTIAARPTFLVHSGYGLHMYWLFRELYVIDDAAARQWIAQLNQRLQTAFQAAATVHGWTVDSTFNLDRVLRLPGTINHKRPEALRPVEILEADEDCRYNPSELDQLLPEIEVITGEAQPFDTGEELPSIDVETLDIPVWIKYLIAQGQDPTYRGKHPSRSEAHGHATEALLKAGIDPAIVMSVLLDPRYKISERPREKGRSWLADDIARIKAKLNGHRPTGTSAPAPADDEQHTSSNGDEQDQLIKPIIQLSTDMTAVVDTLERHIRTMPNAPRVFQRSRKLSVIALEAKPLDWLHRPPDAPAMAPVEAAYLRELAAAAADWQRYDDRKKDGEKWVKTLPPEWAIKTLLARPFSRLPILEGLISAPTLRPDGSILDAPGYDAKTGLYACFHRETFPSIIQHPTIDDARQSINAIKDLLQDFRFAKPSHGAAALAATCSIVCRFAVVGCIPLFGVSATAAGSGKGLLVDAITMSATGRSAPRWAQTSDNEEERKRLFAIAVEGDQVVHVDNVVQPLGSPALDMAITAGTVKERIMKTLTNDHARIYVCFFASGNNLAYKGDLARRVVPIELDPEMERPEERTGFVYDPLLDAIQKRWQKLAVHALTIIRAFVVAGRPSQKVAPFGSFESWSKTIREALIWAQEPDPCEGRKDMRAENDIELDALRALMVCWQDCYQQQSVSARKVVQDIKLYTAGDGVTKWIDLQEALKTLSRSHQERLTSIQVGYVLRSYKGRVVGGQRFIRVRGDDTHPGEWQLATC